MTEEELDRLADMVVDKLQQRGPTHIYIASPVGTRWPEAPQWWQPGGSPTCGVSIYDPTPYTVTQ